MRRAATRAGARSSGPNARSRDPDRPGSGPHGSGAGGRVIERDGLVRAIVPGVERGFDPRRHPETGSAFGRVAVAEATSVAGSAFADPHRTSPTGAHGDEDRDRDQEQRPQAGTASPLVVVHVVLREVRRGPVARFATECGDGLWRTDGGE